MSRADAPLRVAVVGTGHLGSIHARILAGEARAELTHVVDADAGRATALADELGAAALTHANDLPGDLDAAVVAVPTALHATVAVPLLERGVACLVEKPLAASTAEADRILAAARAGGAALAVGHVERFQPGLLEVRAMGLAPRFIECHRLAPFSFRSTDVGVVHDLMIHDLDLVMDLVDSPVASVDSAGGAILTDAEDIASVRLVFENGARANVTASRASLKPMRRFRMFSPDAYVSLDFHQNYGLMVRKGAHWNEGREALRTLSPAELAERGDLVEQGLIEVAELELSEAERPLQAELKSFLDAVAQGTTPEVTGEDGRRALDLADRIAAAIREQAW